MKMLLCICCAFVLIGCSSGGPAYYGGQKGDAVKAMKAAVTEDTWLLFHTDGKAFRKLFRILPSAGKAFMADADFLLELDDDYHLLAVQLTVDKQKLLVTAVFEKGIDLDELSRIVKRRDERVEEKGDGQYALGDSRMLVTGKRRVLYLGSTKGICEDAAEAFAKGRGEAFAKEATEMLRKDADYYLVLRRSAQWHEAWESDKSLGPVPEFVALAANGDKWLQADALYSGKSDARDAEDSFDTGFRNMQEEKGVPEKIRQFVKEVKWKRKDRQLTATWEGDVLELLATLFNQYQ